MWDLNTVETQLGLKAEGASSIIATDLSVSSFQTPLQNDFQSNLQRESPNFAASFWICFV